MRSETKRNAKRILTFSMAVMVAAGVFSDGGYSEKQSIAHAADATTVRSINDDIDDQEADIADLEKKQKELDEKIKAAEGGIDSEEEKQAAITEQISTVETTLQTLAGTITDLEAQISETEKAISKNEAAIETKKQEIEDGVGDLKKRLRVMYIAGNDSYSQILIGASDFYDMLMKLELIRRVAEHDNDLIDGLMDLKSQYEDEEKELAANKKKLETDLKDLESRRKKQTAQMKKLKGLYADSNIAIATLEKDKAAYENNKEQLKKEQDEFEKQLEDLIKEREKAAAEEKKRKEEEERKKKEEEARKKKEEEERKKQQEEEESGSDDEDTSGDSSSDNGGGYEDESGGSDDQSGGGSSDNGGGYEEEEEEDDEDYGGGSSDNGGYDPNAAYGYVPKSNFTWPVPGHYNITCGVGPRWGSVHNGIDIATYNIRGANIIASDSGTVILVNNSCPHDYGKTYSCGCGYGYGNYCIIAHDGGYYTLYGHSERITVSQGQEVKKGDVLGTVGSTGFSTGEHLHFEIRLGNQTLDPEDFV